MKLNKMVAFAIGGFFAALVGVGAATTNGTVSLPYTFNSGETIVADQFNADFQSLATGINNLSQTVASVQATAQQYVPNAPAIQQVSITPASGVTVGQTFTAYGQTFVIRTFTVADPISGKNVQLTVPVCDAGAYNIDEICMPQYYIGNTSQEQGVTITNHNPIPYGQTVVSGLPTILQQNVSDQFYLLPDGTTYPVRHQGIAQAVIELPSGANVYVSVYTQPVGPQNATLNTLALQQAFLAQMLQYVSVQPFN